MNSEEALSILLNHLRELQDKRETYLRDPLHTNDSSIMMKDVTSEINGIIRDIFVLKQGIAAAARIRERALNLPI